MLPLLQVLSVMAIFILNDHAYIGTGAVIKQGTPDKPLMIGKGAVVGMGAVVTKSVPRRCDRYW